MRKLLQIICTLPDEITYEEQPLEEGAAESEPVRQISKEYLYHWERVGNQITRWLNENILKSLFEISNEDAGNVGSDLLLPVCIAVVPTDDRDLLMSVQRKLYTALSILPDIIENYSIILGAYTTISSSLAFVLAKGQSANKLSAKESRQLWPVINFLHTQDQLFLSCLHYKEVLIEQVELRLKKNHPGLYQHYFQDTTETKDQILTRMHNEIISGNSPFKDNSEIAILLSKHMCVYDFFITLDGPADAIKCASVLQEKLQRYSEIIDLNGKSSSFLHRLTSMSGIYVDNENCFFTLARSYTPPPKKPEKPAQDPAPRTAL